MLNTTTPVFVPHHRQHEATTEDDSNSLHGISTVFEMLVAAICKLNSRTLPQMLIGLILGDDTIAHFPRGKARLQLFYPLSSQLLLLAKQAPERLEFALSSPLCWQN